MRSMYSVALAVRFDECKSNYIVHVFFRARLVLWQQYACTLRSLCTAVAAVNCVHVEYVNFMYMYKITKVVHVVKDGHFALPMRAQQ